MLQQLCRAPCTVYRVLIIAISTTMANNFTNVHGMLKHIHDQCRRAIWYVNMSQVLTIRIYERERSIVYDDLVKQCRDYADIVTHRSFVRDPNTLFDYYPTDTISIPITHGSNMDTIQTFYRRDPCGIQSEFEQVLNAARTIHYNFEYKFDRLMNKYRATTDKNLASIDKKREQWCTEMQLFFCTDVIDVAKVKTLIEDVDNYVNKCCALFNKWMGIEGDAYYKTQLVPRITDMSYLQKDHR